MFFIAEDGVTVLEVVSTPGVDGVHTLSDGRVLDEENNPEDKKLLGERLFISHPDENPYITKVCGVYYYDDGGRAGAASFKV